MFQMPKRDRHIRRNLRNDAETGDIDFPIRNSIISRLRTKSGPQEVTS